MIGDVILIVDDDEDFSKILGMTLKHRYYQVVRAKNGEDGLQKAEQIHPKLILLDIKMPQMDGLTFVHHLKKNDKIKDIPVIILTGYEPMRDMFQFEGVADYFVKTSDKELLFKTIEKNLQPK
jgi:CheY-like chemotaxis protein